MVPFLKPLFCLLLLSTCFWSKVLTARIEGKISPNAVLQDLSLLEPTTRIALNGMTYSSLVKKDGTFAIENVPIGEYLLEVESTSFIFPKIRLNIDADAIRPVIHVLGTEWDNPTASIAPYPLNITAAARSNYFTERPGFQVMSLLANPMMLMMGFSLVMLFLIPKIQSSLDPEMLEEVEETRQRLLNPAAGSVEVPSLSAVLAGVDQPKTGSKKSGKRR